MLPDHYCVHVYDDHIDVYDHDNHGAHRKLDDDERSIFLAVVLAAAFHDLNNDDDDDGLPTYHHRAAPARADHDPTS
ncbi:MAG: hypothetical protein K0S92_1293 [Desertimonas sp.]|nr:hypothetical protein [Desertimonas sp.]